MHWRKRHLPHVGAWGAETEITSFYSFIGWFELKRKKNKTPKADGFLKIVTFRNVFSNTYKQQQQKQHPLTYLRGFPPTKPRITIFALIYFLSYSSVISWSLCNKPCDISPLVADLGMQMRSGTEGGGIVPLNLSELIRNTIMPCSLIINHS